MYTWERKALDQTAQALVIANRLDADLRFIRGAQSRTPGGVPYTMPARVGVCKGYHITGHDLDVISVHVDIEIPLEEIVVDCDGGQERIAPGFKLTLRAYDLRCCMRPHCGPMICTRRYFNLDGLDEGLGSFLYAVTHPVYYTSGGFGCGYGFKWTHREGEDHILKERLSNEEPDCENNMIPLHVNNCYTIVDLTSTPMVREAPEESQGSSGCLTEYKPSGMNWKSLM